MVYVCLVFYAAPPLTPPLMLVCDVSVLFVKVNGVCTFWCVWCFAFATGFAYGFIGCVFYAFVRFVMFCLIHVFDSAADAVCVLFLLMLKGLTGVYLYFCVYLLMFLMVACFVCVCYFICLLVCRHVIFVCFAT